MNLAGPYSTLPGVIRVNYVYLIHYRIQCSWGKELLFLLCYDLVRSKMFPKTLIYQIWDLVREGRQLRLLHGRMCSCAQFLATFSGSMM